MILYVTIDLALSVFTFVAAGTLIKCLKQASTLTRHSGIFLCKCLND